MIVIAYYLFLGELKKSKELSLALLAEELRTIDWETAIGIVFNFFNYLNFINY